jgi:hypothetical protein
MKMLNKVEWRDAKRILFVRSLTDFYCMYITLSQSPFQFFFAVRKYDLAARRFAAHRFAAHRSLFEIDLWASLHHRIKISNRRATQRCNVSSFFMQLNMQFTGQKAEQPASTACSLARKCHWLARKMAANMRNATCARTETSKLPT